MNSENNNFNNETNNSKNDSLNNSNGTANETPINYTAVSGNKEYIYGDTYDEKKAPESDNTSYVNYESNNYSKTKKPKKRILSTIALVVIGSAN